MIITMCKLNMFWILAASVAPVGAQDFDQTAQGQAVWG